MNNRDFKSKSL